jgi:hypothetical protein
MIKRIGRLGYPCATAAAVIDIRTARHAARIRAVLDIGIFSQVFLQSIFAKHFLFFGTDDTRSEVVLEGG